MRDPRLVSAFFFVLGISGAMFNTEEEVAAAVGAAREILDSGEHARFARQRRRPG